MPRAAREIPWLDQRSNGVYYVKWYDRQANQTQKQSLRTRSAEEAQALYAAFLSNGRDIYESTNDTLTVARALDQYLTEHVAAKCAAWRRQEIAIRWLTEFFGETAIQDIDVAACRRYVAARLAGEVGKRPGVAATAKRDLVALSAAARHAVKWKRLPASSLPTIELPTVVEPETAWYTKDEVKSLMMLAEGDLQHFIRIAYWTGARRASIETLHTSQVDFENKRIRLGKTGARITKKRRPVVPLFEAIEPTMRELATGDHLFDQPADFYKRFKTLCRRLGMTGRAKPHLLRHSRATHLLQDGKSIYAVAKLLGDTVTTVERVYGHHSPEFLAEALDAEL